jgi:long-chain acyl-CoA synthetase
VVNVGGLKVYPAEIDDVLRRCPGVADAAAYGATDPILGEQLRAAVVPQAPGLAGGEVLRFCREQLASYKVPTSIELRESIPRNPTGKILRRVLRAEAEQQDQGRPGPRSVVRDVGLVRAWIGDWLEARLGVGLAPGQARLTFGELGLSSMLGLQLARDLSDEFGVPLEATASWSYPTVEQLARRVVLGADAGRLSTAAGLR